MDPMVQSQIKEWVILLAAFGFLGYGLHIVGATVRRRQRNGMQQHVLDRFASARDFGEFLQSPAGQKYMLSLTDAAMSPHDSILSSVRSGVVLLFLGLGFGFGNFGHAGHIYLRVGLILGFLGIGYLVSACISYWLAQKLHREAKE